MIKYYLSNTNIVPLSFNNQIEINTLVTADPVGTEIVKSRTVNNSVAIIAAYELATPYSNTLIEIEDYIFSTYAQANVLGNGVSQVIGTILGGDVSAATLTTTGTGSTRTATASTGTPFVNTDYNIDITKCAYIRTPQGQYPITQYISSTVVMIGTPAGYTNESAVAFTKYSPIYTMTTGDIISTDLSLYNFSFAPNNSISLLNSKIEIIYFAKTSSIEDTIVSFSHNGSEHVSTFQAPFVLCSFLADFSPIFNTANLTGTPNQVILTGDGTGALVGNNNIQLGTAQDIAPTSSPAFNSLTLTEAKASPLTVASSAQVNNLNANYLQGYTAANFALSFSTSAVYGTANQVNVSGTGTVFGGTLTFSLPQPIATTSSPSFANLTATTGINVGTATSAPAGTIYANDGSGHSYYGLNSKNLLGIYDGDAYLMLNNGGAGGWYFQWSPTVFSPYNSLDTIDLGSSSVPWNNLYLKGNANLSGLTASSLVATDSNKNLASVSNGTGNQVLGMDAKADAFEYKTIQGTTNQVSVTMGVGSITLSTPQNTNITDTPIFNSLTLSEAKAAPLTISSTALVSNFNANYLQGYLASYFQTAAGVSAVRTFYVGKHGNDSNTGVNWENAFLTFGAAQTAINALRPTPAYMSAWALIICLDCGIYTENLAIKTGTFVYAPLANFVGQNAMEIGSVFILAKGQHLGSNYFLTITGGPATFGYRTYVKYDTINEGINPPSYAPGGILIQGKPQPTQLYGCNDIIIEGNELFIYNTTNGGICVNALAQAVYESIHINNKKYVFVYNIANNTAAVINSYDTIGTLYINADKFVNLSSNFALTFLNNDATKATTTIMNCNDFGGCGYTSLNGTILGNGGLLAYSAPSITAGTTSNLLGGYKILNSRVIAETGTAASGSASIAIGSAIPQVSSGTQFLSGTYQPLSVNSVIDVEVIASFGLANATDNVCMALFDSTSGSNNAVAAIWQKLDNYSYWDQKQFILRKRLASSSSPLTQKTLSMRAGTGGGNTLYFIAYPTENLGGVMYASIKVTELQPI